MFKSSQCLRPQFVPGRKQISTLTTKHLNVRGFPCNVSAISVAFINGNRYMLTILVKPPNTNPQYANNQHMHFNVYDVLCPPCSHQHVSAASTAIFRVILLQEYKGTMWLGVLPPLHRN